MRNNKCNLRKTPFRVFFLVKKKQMRVKVKYLKNEGLVKMYFFFEKREDKLYFDTLPD